MNPDFLIHRFTSSPDEYNGETTHYLLIHRCGLYQAIKAGDALQLCRWYRSAEDALSHALEDWSEDAVDEYDLDEYLEQDMREQYEEDLYEQRKDAALLQKHSNP